MKSLKRITVHGVLLATITVIAAWTPQAWAAAAASDSAANDTMNGGTGGTGFAAWTTVTVGSNGGFYNNASHITNESGTNPEWGEYANGGTASTASRPFTTAQTTANLQVGQQITVDMANGGVQTGGSEGLSLWNSGGVNTFEVYWSGGANQWTIADNSGTRQSTSGYTPEPVGTRVTFTLTSPTTYSLTLVSNVTTLATTYSGTLSNVSPQAITQLRFFTYNIGGGNNLEIGQISVTCPDTLTITQSPVSQSVPTNDTAVFTAAMTGDSVSNQWQSATTSNGTYSAISGATNTYNVSATGSYTNFESWYAVAATAANNGTWYRCISTDACGNTNNPWSSAQLTTVASVTNAVITTQPANQTVCSNSASTFSVTATGTSDGYQWLQNSNQGWGTGYAWFIQYTNSGSYCQLSTSTNANSTGTGDCTGWNSTGNVNNPTNAFGLTAVNGGIAVTRFFPSAVSAGQWFSIDMDNGSVAPNVTVGFTLKSSLNTNNTLFSFYFLGGQNDYQIQDAEGQHDSGIHYTSSGLRVQVLVGSATGGTNSYSLFVATNECSSSQTTNVFSGVFATNGIPDGVTIYNNNNLTTTNHTYDLYFNNIVAGGAYDFAGNYSTASQSNWGSSFTVSGGANQGDLPIGGATNSTYAFSAQSNNMPYYVIVTNAAGVVVSTIATNAINSVPTITTTSPLISATENVAYVQYFAESGGTAPFTWTNTSGALPTGITLVTNMLSGTATVPGVYSNIEIQVTDNNGCTSSNAFTLPVACNVIIAITNSPTPTVGASYSLQLLATGGTGTYTSFALTGGSYPPGITMNSSGVFSGTATESTNWTFIVTVTDSGGCIGLTTFNVTPSCPTITVSPATLPNGTVGLSYSTNVTASGANGSFTYTNSVGTLPAGLSLASNGQITGTPTSDASQTFTITATDSSGCSSSQVYMVTPACPTLSLSPAAGALTAGTLGTAYSTNFVATGANGSFTYTNSAGSLPPGLTLASGGTLSGTPKGTNNTYTFTVTANDSSGCSTAQVYTLSMNCPTITVSPSNLPPALLVNVAYSTNIMAVGGVVPVTFTNSAGTLPTGLTLGTNGVLSGTPTATNTYNFTITATDSNSCIGTQVYTVVVEAPPAITTQPANQSACSNSAATFSVTASGTSDGYDWLQNSNNGWGGGNGWAVISAGSGAGVYLGTSTNNDPSGGYCTGFGQDDINSPVSGNALGIYGPTNKIQRIFPSALTTGQWFSIDMDNGNVDTGSQNGFSLHSSLSPTNGVMFAFYFLGGSNQYLYSDATGVHGTGIAFTRTGLRVQLLVGSTLPGTNIYTYSLYFSTNSCGGAALTNQFEGVFSTNGAPGAVLVYNNNSTGGTAKDEFFNNIIAGGAYDNADNYTNSTWYQENVGDLPISGATGSSYTINNTTNSGTYYVIATNAVGAAVSSNVTLTVNALPTTYLVTGGGTNCGGSVSVGLSGSQATVNYQLLLGGIGTGTNWTGTGSALSTNVAASGTYTILASNTTGCTQLTTNSVVVLINPLPTLTFSSSNNTVCGASGGMITVNASGGTAPYTYSDGGSYQSTNVFTNLVSATYLVTVEDANSCISTSSQVMINDPSGPTFSFTQVNDTCNGGADGSFTVTASANGGSGSPYIYSDNNGSTYVSGNTFSGLSAGSYTTLVKDSGGCVSTSQVVTITQPGAITFGTSQGNVSCYGGASGSITVTSASGGNGAPYMYSDGGAFQSSSTFSGLSTGTYQIVVEDASNCTSAATGVTITQPSSALSCSVAPSIATVCAGSSQTFTASGSGGTAGYTYSWTGPNGHSTNTASIAISSAQTADAGTYTNTVTDADGCTSICTATLTVNSAPTVSNPTNLTVCSESEAQFSVMATGTSPQYYWRQRGAGWGAGNAWSVNLYGGGDGTNGTFIGDSSINSGGSGTHSNINSSAGTAFGIYANNGQNVDVYRGFGTLAVGASIQVDIENGFINTGDSVGFGIKNSILTNLWEFYFTGGQSFYTLHDSLGANATTIPYTTNGLRITFVLTSPTNYTATIVTPTTGGTTYTLSGVTITPFAGGNVPAELHFWNNNAGSGSAYDYFFNNLFIDGVPGTASVGLYSDDAVDYTTGGGFGTGNNYGQGPIANVLPGNTEFSNENTATLTINPAESIDASNYDVVVTNSCGAARSNPATLTVNALPNIYNVGGGGAYCGGGNGVSVTLSNTDIGVDYQLELANSPAGSPVAGTGSALTFSNQTAAGTYTVVANNATTGCAATMSGSATVTINPTPSCMVTPSNAVICAGSSQMFTVNPSGGTPGYTYLWSDGSTGTSITTNAAGTYSVTVTDSNECMTTCSAMLTVNPTPSCTVSPASATICAGGSQMFTVNPSGGTPGYTYLWNTGATTSNITASAAGTYSVTVTDSNGCTTTCGATLTVNPTPAAPTAGNNGPIIEGNTLNLTASTVAGVTYSWAGPNSFTSGTQNPSISNATSAASGTYSVTVTDGNGCTNGSSTTAVVTALRITAITLQGSSIQITWATSGGTTDELQSAQGNPGYNTNFTDFAGPFVIPGSGDTSTNYTDVGAATNSPAKFYRVRLVP